MDKISDAEHAQAEVASDFLSAMANPKRLLILKVLVEGEIARHHFDNLYPAM